MINLKTILSAVARTFGISSPEDLQKQKRVTSKSAAPKTGQELPVDLGTASNDRPAEPSKK